MTMKDMFERITGVKATAAMLREFEEEIVGLLEQLSAKATVGVVPKEQVEAIAHAIAKRHTHRA